MRKDVTSALHSSYALGDALRQMEACLRHDDSSEAQQVRERIAELGSAIDAWFTKTIPNVWKGPPLREPASDASAAE